MLEHFKNEQPVAYRIMKNAIKSNRLSHAYLIEANGYSKKNELGLAFAKFLLCENHHTKLDENEFCPVCSQEDSTNILDIKIIKPDGLWIKKEQLETLQHQFETKSFTNSKKIYIIENAESLNSASSNSILKFLEEPEEGIVAILIVDNLYRLLPTIVSRCQAIHLNNDFIKENIGDPLVYLQNLSILTCLDEKEEAIWKDKIEHLFAFALYFETNGEETLLHLAKLWTPFFSTKEEFQIGLDILLYIYKDALNKSCDRPLEVFHQNLSQIQKIQSNNTIVQLCDKINIIRETKESILYNLNLNLLMDKFILSLKEVK
ncbi:MAG: hypothetical protein PHN72_00670 [Bacilli bacterium]|nr:hypothetical protein [Bacilli bacterium]